MRNLETAKSTNGKVNKRVKGEHIRNFLREKKLIYVKDHVE